MRYQLPIASERLDYLPLSTADYASWEPFFIDNPGLRFVAINNPGDPKDEAKIWVDRQLKRYEDNGFGYLKLIDRNTGDLVGHTGLIHRVLDGEDTYEIAYSMLPAFWGRGYASEASQRMQDYVREHKVWDRAMSIIHFDNIASQKVAEKNGLKRVREWEYMGMPVYVYELMF